MLIFSIDDGAIGDKEVGTSGVTGLLIENV
jgi:hypothetical protein